MIALLSYLFYFVAASASPIQRRWLANKRDFEGRGQINFAFQVSLVVVFLSLFIPLFSPFNLTGNAYYLLGLSVLSGAFGAGFLISSYIAQKHVEAGVTVLVGNIYTPITILLAWIFLGEKLTGTQIVGTILLLLAIVLISKKHRIGKLNFDKYFLLTVASGAMLGVTLVAERALQKTTGFTAGTMLSWGAQALGVGIVALATHSVSGYSKKDVAITGVLRFLQILSWVIVLFVVGNLSLVSAITTFKVVIVFIVAALVLKERDDLPRKIVGSLIAVLGLLLMK